MPWPQSKLYSLVALFTLGGISSFYIAETLPLLLPFFACYFLLVLTLHLLIKGKKTLTSGLVYLGYYFFGLVYFQSYYTLPQSHYSNLNSSSQKAIKKIVLENDLGTTLYQHRWEAELVQWGETSTSGNLIVQFPLTFDTQRLNVGQVIWTQSELETIKPPANPSRFSYKAFLKNQSLFHTLTIDTLTTLFGSTQNKPLKLFFTEIKKNASQKIQNSALNDESKAMLHALLLADRSELDTSLVEDYTQAGIIHLLALSGLHIGLFVGLLMLLLYPLQFFPYGRIFRVVLVLLFLWGFAFLVGFPASVVRSVSLFSCVVIGSQISHGKNTLHFTVVSFFILLLVYPPFLRQVGFQLSYLAVFGILLISPPLEKIWRPKNLLLLRLWQWTTVCLSAQLAVSPISIYYFHQFPGLFLVSNLVVITFFGFFIGLCLLVFSLLVFFQLPHIIASLFDEWVRLQNLFVAFIAGQDDFIFTQLYPSLATTLLLYFLCFTIVLSLYRKTFIHLIWVLCSGLLAIVYLRVEHHFAKNENSFWIFDRYQASFVGHLQQGTFHYFSSDPKKTARIRNDFMGIYQIEQAAQIELKNFYSAGQMRLLVLDSLQPYALKKLNPTHILLRNNPRINVDRLLSIYRPKYLISNGSNFPWNAVRLKVSCEEKGILFYNTREKGAFKINLETEE